MTLLTIECIAYTITAVITLLIGFYLYAKHKHSYWSKRGVKTPPTHILFGNFKDTLTLKKQPGVLLQDLYDSVNRDDPYVGSYVFHKPILILRDLELIKQIMVKDFDIFPNRVFGSGNQKDSVGLTNLLSIHSSGWKYLRNKLSPALTGQKLKRMIPLMETCIEPMLEFIDGTTESTDGWKKIEVKSLASRFSTDVISSLAFGITTNSFNENDIAFWEAGQKILTGLKRGIILIILFLLPTVARIIEPLTTGPAKFFRHIFWDSMNSREKHGNQRGDLIDTLLALKNGEQNPKFKFEGDNLLAQAVAFYVAGFEAISTAIAFSLFELARHPEHQDRLYEEIQKIIVKDGLTMESVQEMTFLEDVVNEVLRLYPPLPVVDRIAIRDYKFPGTDLIIEKGTPLYVPIRGVNQDSRYFSDPYKFIPEREKNGSHKIHESLAFGIGPRSCIGQRLGLLITKVAVIAIVMNYKISYDSNQDKILNPVTVFTNAIDGIFIKLRKRTECT